jgi:hypothetical protein
MNNIIIDDIKLLIKYLYNNYNSKYDLDFLYKRYVPNISIEKKNEISENKLNKSNKSNKFIKFKKRNYIPSKCNRCIARCWGGEKSVKYNIITKKWTYGTQCSRYKFRENYCLTHYKQSISNYGCTHGIFSEEPPHPHYNKYKIKIENVFKLKQ